MAFKMKGFPRYSAPNIQAIQEKIASGIKEPDNKKEKKPSRWRQRRNLIKQYMNDGLSREEAREIALRSLPKKWGKNKGSW
tara:strand:- start:817 stop:1059 length:243 start_codon:yes stop_codon:yes gene_type:complete